MLPHQRRPNLNMHHKAKKCIGRLAGFDSLEENEEAKQLSGHDLLPPPIQRHQSNNCMENTFDFNYDNIGITVHHHT